MPSHRFEHLQREYHQQRYFASLDGLRTFSIIPVVWHHATPWPYAGILGRGPIGVDLFFAISGYLITTLLLRERTKHGQINLAAFYARRSLRIFPLYYLVLGLHVAFALWVRPNWDPSRNFLPHALYYATYTANWVNIAGAEGPALFMFGWSLCTEEQFYAFWAPVLRFCRRLWIAAAVMGSWLVIDLLLEGAVLSCFRSQHLRLYTVVTSFASPIGLGALVAMALQHRTTERWLWLLCGHRFAAPLIGSLILSMIAFPWAPVVWLHLGLALLVVSCSLRRDHGLARLLDNPPMRFVGQVSYGIYLWHVPVIGALRTAIPNLREQAFVTFACALPLSVAVAALSHRGFERPLLSLGARFRRI